MFLLKKRKEVEKMSRGCKARSSVKELEDMIALIESKLDKTIVKGKIIIKISAEVKN